MLRRFSIFLAITIVACGGGPVGSTPGAKNVEATANGWSLAYKRHCEGSMTPPVVGGAGQFGFCNARFDVESGRFRGVVDRGLLALVDDTRGVFASSRGLRLGRVVKGVSQDTLAVAEGIYTETTVLSPRRTEIVSFEASTDSTSGALVVRELPSLRMVRGTPGVRVSSSAPPVLGWLADGREVVVGSSPCSSGVCPSTLFVVERGELAPLGPPFVDASVIAIDARGERAVVARSDGVRVVAMPSGETIAEIESPPPGVRHLAISEDGARVALADAHAVRIYGPSLRAGSLRREHEALMLAESVQFSPNGKTLLVGQGVMMVALRTDAPPVKRRVPTLSYEPHLPPSFETAERAGAAGGANDAFAFGEDARGEPGLFAWYRRRDHMVDVVASSFEASQIDDVKELESWARLVALRFGMTDAIGAAGWRVWQDDKQRSVTMARRIPEGCDPHDSWVRFTERDGILYRVSVDTAPGTPAKTIGPLVRTFLIEPFGDKPTMKLSFRFPRVPWLPGSC